MTYGPIDFLALEFKGSQFKGEIFPIVVDLVNQGIVRIIDILVVQKAPDGKVTSREIQEHDKAVLELFDPTRSEITGMIQVEDIEIIGEKLEPNTTAALLLFENLWAVKFVQAVENANGRPVMHVRIPHDVVVETMAKITSEEEKTEAAVTLAKETKPEAAL